MVSDCDHPSATDCHVSIIYTFLIPCCDVRYDFHVKQCSVHLYSHLFCMSFVYYYVICYFLMYTGVQQDIHITWCSCRDFRYFGVGVALSLVFFVVFCTSIVCPFSFGHCIFPFLLAIVFSFFFWPLYFPFFPPSIYGFWLPLWYLQSFRNSNTSGVTNGAGTTHLAEYLSAPPFKWGSCCTMFSLLYSIMSTIICLFLRPLYCLSFKVRCLITPFGHCIVCSSSKYGVWLPHLAIVLSVLLQSMASDYPLWYLDHCIVYPSIYSL